MIGQPKRAIIASNDATVRISQYLPWYRERYASDTLLLFVCQAKLGKYFLTSICVLCICTDAEGSNISRSMVKLSPESRCHHLSAQSLCGLMLTETISGCENFGNVWLKIMLRNWTLNLFSSIHISKEYSLKEAVFIERFWGRRSPFLCQRQSHNSCHKFHTQADSVKHDNSGSSVLYLKFWLHFVLLLYLHVSKRRGEIGLSESYDHYLPSPPCACAFHVN